jgi:hypothetical protein
MEDVQLFGRPSCRHKLLYPLLRLNTLPCLSHYETYFLLCFLFKKFAQRVFKLSVPSPTYSARFLKTTPVHWNSPGFQSFALVPSTLAANVADMSATCRNDTRFCSNFGQMGRCRQHKIEDVGTFCVGLSQHPYFPPKTRPAQVHM